MDYIKTNNEVTLKSLQNNRTPEIIQGVKDRFNDVLNMVGKKLQPEMRISDFGCKDGILLDMLKEKGFQNLTGVDCCQDVVDIVTEKGFICLNVDIQNLPFDENFTDFIFLIHTLEHVPQPEKVIAECARILSPKGYLFVEIPIQQFEEPELWGHFHPFTYPDELLNLASLHFDLIKQEHQQTKSRKPWYRYFFQKI